MNKEDMISLIKAVEAFNRLNDTLIQFTSEYGIDNEDYNDLYEIYEVLRRNSIYSGESDYDEDMFRAIINAINISAEDKYLLLQGKEI